MYKGSFQAKPITSCPLASPTCGGASKNSNQKRNNIVPKIRLNASFVEFHGSVGDIVYRQHNEKVYASVKPKTRKAEPTAAQTAHRERFSKAAAFGRRALSNPTMREYYEQVAESRDLPIVSVAIADFFNAPVVKQIDLSSYNGQAGDPILIEAADDLGVVSVHVSIIDGQDNSVESGSAVETPDGWVYTATATLPQGTNAYIKVVAADRPGGTGLMKVSKTV